MEEGETGKFPRGASFLILWTALSALIPLYGLSLLWKPLMAVTWKTAPCVIERFEITDDRDAKQPFRADLVFHYEINGTRYEGTRLWPRDEASEHYEDISEIREALAKGESGSLAGVATECRVSRFDPTKASLRLERWDVISGGIATIIAGGLFVLVGVAALADFVRNGSLASAYVPKAVLLFFGSGGLAVLGVVIGQCLEVAEKEGWKETSAQVVWSRVARIGLGKRQRNLPDLFYRYESGGREYRSNHYDITRDYRRGEVPQIVASHPEGSVLKVFVDPDKPWRAVVDRNSGGLLLLSGFALALAAAGGAGSWWLLKVSRRRDTVPPLVPRRARRSRALRDRLRGKW